MARDQFHIVVFCWPRVIDNVLEICRQLESFECRKTVIDASGEAPRILSGWEWIAIDPRAYYGDKFAFSLRMIDSDAVLFIVGDIEFVDWQSAASVSRKRLADFPDIGVWSAELDYTGWPTRRTSLGQIPDTEMHMVVQTDACVWAIRRSILLKLREMNFSGNSMGWGIDWAAMVFCYGSGLIAVRDNSISVHHPTIRGYGTDEAVAQMKFFMDQMTVPEKALLEALYRSVR